jgi:hypothetical protein
MDRLCRSLFVVLSISVCWLGTTALHELGHVVNAWLSGGQVTGVELPPRGLGHTLVSPNPHPQFVAWGGASWGSLLGLATIPLARRSESHRWFVRFFAGTCLTANGVYIGLGGFFGDANGADDAHELLRHGAAAWQLVVFGILATVIGLTVWHRLGPRLGLARAAQQAGWLATAMLLATSVLLLVAGIVTIGTCGLPAKAPS